MKPRRLKLGTHVDSGQMYRVYQNQAVSIYSSLYFFMFLSSYQTLKFFVTLFPETVRPRRLKLGTHMNNGQMYRVYLYFSVFFLSNIQTWKFFLTLFSGTVRPRRLKLATHVEYRWMYLVYWSHAAALIRPFIFIFLSLQFSNIKDFRHTFLKNCAA